jgi:hypothetical protein
MVKRNATREVFSFLEDISYARQIARFLRVPIRRVSTHQFPDGETLASIRERRTRSDAILVRRLDHPNLKILETLGNPACLSSRNVSPPTLFSRHLASSLRVHNSVEPSTAGKLREQQKRAGAPSNASAG